VNFHNRADRVSGNLTRFAAFSRLRNVRLKGGGGLLRSHVVYERSPEFLSVMTEALFGAPAAPRPGWVVRLKDRVLTWGENLLAPFALTSSIAFGLAFVVLVVIGPAYLVSLPFRWTLGETLAVRIENGFALFTLFGMTIAMILRFGLARGRAEAVRASGQRSRSRGTRPRKRGLVQDFVAGHFVEVFDVGDFERAHGLNRRHQRLIGLARSPPLRQLSPGGSQRSKDLRAIESLPRTMLAETHSGADLVLNITVTLLISHCPFSN
jgi:hypothetical protein